MSRPEFASLDAMGVVPGDRIHVHVYGVGHGDCVLVELEAEGRPAFRMLCDSGKDATHVDELVTYLRANRRRDGVDLDVVSLTHVDDDHQGGLRRLFAAADITIGLYWGPCLPAFRRLEWLFPKRVQAAVTHAAERERDLLARKCRVLYPLELGWVVVQPGAQGGKSFLLCSGLLEAAPSQGVFATTGTENGRMQSTLGKLGFKREGRVWDSVEGDEQLCLFTLTS